MVNSDQDLLAWIYFEAWLAHDEVLDLEEWGESMFHFVGKFRYFEENLSNG